MLLVLLVSVALLLALGVLAPLLVGRGGGTASGLVYGASFVICAANAAVAAVAFVAGTPSEAVLPVGLPWLSAHFRLDGLAAFFVMVVNGIGAAAAWYGLGYGRHEDEPGRVLPFFPVYLAGMTLVPLADDAFAFLIGWEAMSVASWLLVLAHHRSRETREAAYVYLIMAAFGTAAMILAFGVLAGAAGDYTFATIRTRDLSPAVSGLVLALLFIGAGSKAGVVPLHAWLPLAHPAAPSHVSSLMSGVMTKVAIYAIVRVLFDLAGPVHWGWSVGVLAIGAATAVLGVLYALMQHDLKTLLAYHTVENIGIIVIGIGLALAFRANGEGALAALALAAALLHVINHALFKSLLFLGAGAVQVATGERDMERLGGLIHAMPRTAFLFLVGCFAISALPPLNGFVSEWLTFQVILNGPLLSQWGLKFTVPVTGALLALSAALAAACFVKAFGITFLGRPRSGAAAAAAEVDVFMRGAMAALAAACVILGVLPALALEPLARVVAGLTGAEPFAAGGAGWVWLVPVSASAASYSAVIVFVAVAALAAVLVVAMRKPTEGRVRRAPAWDCGFPDPRPETQYTASSFAQPIRRVFGSVVFAAREEIDMPEPGEMRPARFEAHLVDPVWDGLYQPVAALVSWATLRLNVLQFLTIRKYLTLMFGALVVLLVVVVVAAK